MILDPRCVGGPAHARSRTRTARTRPRVAPNRNVAEANAAPTCQVIIRAIKRGLPTLVWIELPTMGRLGSQSLSPAAEQRASPGNWVMFASRSSSFSPSGWSASLF
ncbi:hypothetical protein ZIOFF_067445 [Zingiber officinale]|uniref:Uncharacterized protein n=1 Tax=Zingiber officinale TaxID=94328 RepID=A0A8J5CX80_ZINOF|nr:hypothetical protein ZIOFF_067445 [Zingiber officinale]